MLCFVFARVVKCAICSAPAKCPNQIQVNFIDDDFDELDLFFFFGSNFFLGFVGVRSMGEKKKIVVHFYSLSMSDFDAGFI